MIPCYFLMESTRKSPLLFCFPACGIMNFFSYFSIYSLPTTQNLETDLENLGFGSKSMYMCVRTHTLRRMHNSCRKQGLYATEVEGTWLAKLDLRVMGMHWVKSASSKMIAGFLPPSSSESRLQCGALFSMIRWAVSVLPVKEIRGTSGWQTRASPVLAPVPNTTFTTPWGTPDGKKGTQSSYPFPCSAGFMSLCFVSEFRKLPVALG